MKQKIVGLMTLCCLIMPFITSCSKLDFDFSNEKVDIEDLDLPAGALPSQDFQPNSLADEPCANHAVKVEATEDKTYFSSIELFADGTFLIQKTYRNYIAPSESTRASANSELEGTYEILSDNGYRLSNGWVLYIIPAEGENAVRIRVNIPNIGEVDNIEAQKVPQAECNDFTRSLCRTWETESVQTWMYLGKRYVGYLKAYFIDGELKIERSGIFDFEVEDDEEANAYDDEEDEEEVYNSIVANIARYVTFSASGTYFLRTDNGTRETKNWKWKNQSDGLMHWWTYYNNGIYSGGDAHVRFKGKQMRLYENKSIDDEEEGDELIKVVTVTTLRAKN